MATKFGIVGFGFMGHVHLDMLMEMEGAQVTAVCDIDADALKDIPSGIETYTDALEMYQNENIDVVLIAANNDQHRYLVIEAAKAGKHVLCEKPVALSVSDFDEMAAACEKAGVSFTVHQQRRYDVDYRTAKSVFDSGALGDVYTIKSSLYGFNGNMHDWHVFPEQGGGMLYDWGVHLLDQLLWMIPGKLNTVFADLRNVINENVDDYFNILLRFENGILAELELGTYYLSDKPDWFERHWFMGGNKGSMYGDGFNECKGAVVRTSELLTSVASGKRTMTAAGPTRSFGPPPPGRIISQPVTPATTKHSDYFDNYLKTLQGKEDFLVTVPQLRRVLTLMDAVRASAKTGKSVDFEA